MAAILLLTSIYGILQRFGIAEFCGYGVEREPVSVFGNLNVASEWTAVCGHGHGGAGDRNSRASARLAVARSHRLRGRGPSSSTNPGPA